MSTGETDTAVDRLSGRELDAALAEEVMGWKVTTIYGQPPTGGDTLGNTWGATPDVFAIEKPNADGTVSTTLSIKRWSPSTNISAAWEVVERAGQRMDIHWYPPGHDSEPPHPDEPWSYVEVTGHEMMGPNLAENICRAVLAAVRAGGLTGTEL